MLEVLPVRQWHPTHPKLDPTSSTRRGEPSLAVHPSCRIFHLLSRRPGWVAMMLDEGNCQHMPHRGCALLSCSSALVLTTAT